MSGIWKRFKQRINKFINKLAQENQKMYGNGRLDCCDLNKDSSKK